MQSSLECEFEMENTVGTERKRCAAAQLFLAQDHVAVIYNSDKELRCAVANSLLTALFTQNLGYKVVYFYTRTSPDTVKEWLAASGQVSTENINLEIHAENLIFVAANDYFTQAKTLTQRFAFWQSHIQAAYQQGYQCLRILAEMDWALNMHLTEQDVTLYEVLGDRQVFADPILNMICLYDRRRFDAGQLIQAIKSHPVVVVQGKEIRENFYYVLLHADRAELGSAAIQLKEELLEFMIQHLLKWNQCRSSSEKWQRKTLSEFIDLFTHELKKSLHALCATLELLKVDKDRLTEEQLDLVKLNQGLAEHLQNVFTNMVQLASLEQIASPFHEKKFHIREVMRSMELLLSSMERRRQELRKKQNGEGEYSEEEKVDIRTSVDENVPQTVFGDETRLRQILLNLLSNALKATTRGYIRLSVTRVDRQQDQQKQKNGGLCVLQFTCEDSGKGISLAECEKIFDPFRPERGENNALTVASLTSGRNGAGLGLPICRYLCKLMGGKIWVDIEKTKVNQGTIVHFTVNLRVEGEEAQEASASNRIWEARKERDEEEAEEKLQKILGGIEDKQRRRHQLRVLVAEDNKTNQLIAKKMLQRVGVKQVEIVENGVEAVNAALQGKYDVVLLDIFMPLLDGIEAASRIRAATPKGRLVIIAWTASIRDIYEHPETLFDHWLAKPTTVDSLAKILDDLCCIKGE